MENNIKTIATVHSDNTAISASKDHSEEKPWPKPSIANLKSNEEVVVSPEKGSVSKQELTSDADDSVATPTWNHYDDTTHDFVEPAALAKKGMLVPFNGEGKKRSYIITKIVQKKSLKQKSNKIKQLINSLCSDLVVNDTPLFSPTS